MTSAKPTFRPKKARRGLSVRMLVWGEPTRETGFGDHNFYNRVAGFNEYGPARRRDAYAVGEPGDYASRRGDFWARY